jgi:homoserine O-succinyltransferase/O-acetyltransferase
MKRPINIAILDMYNGHTNEGMRCIKTIAGNFLAQEGVEGRYDVFDVRQKNELPDLNQYDIFISSGGPGNPVPQGEAWEKPFFWFLDHLWEYNRQPHHPRKKHLFLICHSFQMAAYHWKLGLVCKRRKTSFGIYPMPRTRAGHQDPVFEVLPEPFFAVDSRDYQLVQPDFVALNRMGAEVLCIEKERPHVALERAIMAIRFSREVVGTQFHPEADDEGMLRYFLTPEKRDVVINNHGEEKYTDMVASLQDPQKIALTESVIIPTFLNLAAQQLDGATHQTLHTAQLEV